ncbi:LolA family protein [Paenibacillus kobensis]|uniref:LolA family protein n=1 Tax=Paenibacillus kobensis TaxID=59841 RepID=UPI000FDB6A71|nr:outer membrane lipoprotein carrier protein LolA [Paenibacillus kobensis]
MRRIVWITAILMCFTIVASACGTKNADSVVKELNSVANKLESYQAKGTMTLNTSQQPLEYQVEVWYQKDHYYRIALTNAKKDITQIVLRNDDGVFVLTPRLNKVFRFQSDWPDNQGQVYLYQTLLSSILLDESRQFASDNDSYVFDVMANYQNGSLARQKIWLNKDDFAPNKVEVSDTNASVMVQVKFDEFKFDPKFDKSAFDTQANLNPGGAPAPSNNASSQDPATDPNKTDNNQPTTGSESTGTGAKGENSNPDNSGTQEDNNSQGDATGDKGVTGSENEPDAASEDTIVQPIDFEMMEPLWFPTGTSFKDANEIVFGGNPGYMLRYQGDTNFTIIQTQPKDKEVLYSPGFMIDLGFTWGSLSDGEEQRTLTWTYEGSEFRLTSADLTEDQMVMIAQSVDASATK